MSTEEKRYRVTAQLVSIHQIVVQGRDEDEARDFANAIDFEKWSYVEGEYEIVDIDKDFFERKLKVEQETELLPTTDGPYLKIVKGQVLVMENNIAQKITAFATILALPFALGAFVLTWAPAQQFYLSDPTYDGFVQPRSISKLVETTQDSTVTVFCDYGVEKYTQGTAFAVDLEHTQGKKYKTTLLTNHHVIEKCLDNNKKIYVLALVGKETEAVIDRVDKENDLAVLVTTLEIENLYFSNYKPNPGYWIAAVGSADGYEGSVAFGNVLNMDKYELLITAPLSSGNSGGPLIDNEGNVVGVNTKTPIGSDYQYNLSMSLDALCLKIMECEDDVFWKVED